jgi:superoxide dismutase, Fe-Mn family
MEIHHKKHHQTYVTNLNGALPKLADAEAKQDVNAIVQLQGVIKFNGGGHVNHSLFWKVCSHVLCHILLSSCFVHCAAF